MQIIDLPAGQMLVLSADAVKHVQVMFGRVWLTETGRLEDVFACSGEVIDLSDRGRVLIEGQGFARIAVVARARQPAWTPVRPLRAGVQRLGRRLRAALAGARSARPVG